MTVVLPLVPVTATMGSPMNRPASSISPITGMPSARAAASGGIVCGTPGLTTIRSAAVKDSVRWPPSSRRIPISRSRVTSGPRRLLLRPVGRPHARAPALQKACGGDPGAGQAYDQNVVCRADPCVYPSEVRNAAPPASPGAGGGQSPGSGAERGRGAHRATSTSGCSWP
ncbi:MAG: hypothetical protein MZV70_32835 [Desulfobacterales bacterium]|nr:hypothetical protein [Desulfobacterales bacterium]